MSSKTGKKKKTGKIVALSIVGVLAVLILVVIIGAWAMFGTFIKAGKTIKKLDDGLYSMEYKGDYGLDEFLAQGGADNAGALSDYLTTYLSHGFYKSESKTTENNYGCSTICANDADGNVLFGRNFDWKDCKTMVVHTVPDNGYESISTCNLDFIGFGDDFTPDGSMEERMESLAAIYVPLDGMNVKGLIVADLVVGGNGDTEETHQHTCKTPVTTTTALRMMLDKCKNVDEAIELLKEYDMNSDIGANHHYAIADASGKSVVVEYVNNEMIVTDTKVVTNFYIGDSQKKGVGSKQSHDRYDKLMSFNGVADKNKICELLESVAQKNYPQEDGKYELTMWSIVYSPHEGDLDFYFKENFDNPYYLKFVEEGDFVKTDVNQ